MTQTFKPSVDGVTGRSAVATFSIPHHSIASPKPHRGVALRGWWTVNIFDTPAIEFQKLTSDEPVTDEVRAPTAALMNSIRYPLAGCRQVVCLLPHQVSIRVQVTYILRWWSKCSENYSLRNLAAIQTDAEAGASNKAVLLPRVSSFFGASINCCCLRLQAASTDYRNRLRYFAFLYYVCSH